jgi:hypothetical protein
MKTKQNKKREKKKKSRVILLYNFIKNMIPYDILEMNE